MRPGDDVRENLAARENLAVPGRSALGTSRPLPATPLSGCRGRPPPGNWPSQPGPALPLWSLPGDLAALRLGVGPFAASSLGSGGVGVFSITVQFYIFLTNWCHLGHSFLLGSHMLVLVLSLGWVPDPVRVCRPLGDGKGVGREGTTSNCGFSSGQCVTLGIEMVAPFPEGCQRTE